MNAETHQRKLSELADQIRAYAIEKNIDVDHVHRRAFERDVGASRTARDFWGPAKELAGGACVAPPVDAIPAGHRLRGVSTLVGADGRLKQQWVKTQAHEPDAAERIAQALERIEGRVLPSVDLAPAPDLDALDEDLLAVYPLGDPHVGLLAWGRESGENFDLAIAEDLMVRAVRDLVRRGPACAGALIVNLGDYFHFDNDAQHTTRGDHALDVDGRTSRVLETGLRIFVAMIDAALERHAFVIVDNVAGNHDRYTSIMLAIALRAHYRNESRVEIPVDPAMRHYFTHGRVLIGTTHGDQTKAESLGAIMAAEKPELWGRSSHRHWLCGHVHHTTAKEVHGVTVETFRTLAARDSWHAAHGYLSGRDLRRIVYHREWGEVSRETLGIAHLETQARAK